MRRREFAAALAGLASATTLGCSRSAAPPQRPAEALTPSSAAMAVGQGAPAMDPSLEVAGCRFRFVIDDEPVTPAPNKYQAWVREAATMVAAYYGRFPVPKLTVQLRTRGGSGVGFGQHQDGRWVRVRVGKGASPQTLATDWVMVHEMLHAAFPDLARRHGWMQEGQATYLEPIVRARSGHKTVEEVWAKWARMMPNGRPRAGDRGLDNTRSWGRLYWGGALFWLHTDVQARLATDNRKGLGDALRAILVAGGDGRANWSTAKVIEVGDAAIGKPVLATAYAQLALAPGDVDLEELWEQLGVQVHSEDKVTLDERAPWAELRRAMV